MLKDSSHHLIGNIFTTTRRLRNKTTIEFDDIPVLLMAFTASLRKHCSIFTLSPFNISTKEHQVNVKKSWISFTTPLTQNEEVHVLDHLTKVSRNEETYLSTGNNVVENNIEPALDITEVSESVAIQLNNELAVSIHKSMMNMLKLELTLHFPTEFVAKYEITLGSKTLYSSNDIPSISEVLLVLSSSDRFKTRRPLRSAAIWKTLKQFRFRLLDYNGEQLSKRLPIVDVMHGALHYKYNTYWRFCSNWCQVRSDRLAVIQQKFRQLLKGNLMSDLDSAYLFKKFPIPSTSTLNGSDNSINPEPSTSASAISQDVPPLPLSQQSSRDNLEQEYNCKYASEGNFLVGDKITANNIELFDLLRYDSVNGKVHIYHVKRKFGQSTRDAASQLTNSAKLIYDDIIGSGEKTLHKHYTQLVEKSDINAKLVEWGITSKEQYLNLFRNNKLTFVYAFVDEDNKTANRSLKDELQIKEKISIADLIEKLELYKTQMNDNTNFLSIINGLNRIVFQLPETETIVIDTLAENLLKFLVKEKFIESNGNVTSKLLFGINFSQMGLINKPMQTFHEFTNKFLPKINFFELVLRQYRSLYQTLIAKIELQRLYRFIGEVGFEFKICEIERESRAPETPVGMVTTKRDCSGSSSSRKKQKNDRSSSKKKNRHVPKGQPLITESLRKAARNLSQDLESQ